MHVLNKIFAFYFILLNNSLMFIFEEEKVFNIVYLTALYEKCKYCIL